MQATVLTGRPGPHCTYGTSRRRGAPRSLGAPPVQTGRPWPNLEAHAHLAPGGVCVVTVEGELDIATQGVLGAVLTDVLARYGPDIVVDASGISFCDARGLGVLVRAANRAERAGGSLRLVGMSPALCSLLRLVGLEHRLGSTLPPAQIVPGRA